MTKKPKTKGTVLVTGAAKRVGKAICLSLSSFGYKIALHYHRSGSEAKKLTKEIQKKGGQCQLFKCDLSNEQQTEQLIASVRKKCSNLNLLINNASIFEEDNLKNFKNNQNFENVENVYKFFFFLFAEMVKKLFL